MSIQRRVPCCSRQERWRWDWATSVNFPRERWVTLVRNLLDYGRGEPVVGRMLRERDRDGLRDFLAFVRRGPDPDLALTDPALFQSLRSAVTRAQLGGEHDSGLSMTVAA